MSSLSVRQAAVQQVSTVIAGLLLCVREIVDWAVVATLLLCLAGRLLASLRGQRKGAASMMRLAGSGERYLGTRGSSDDDPTAKLTSSPRPPSRRRDLGEQGQVLLCPLSDSSSSVVEA